MKNRTFKIRGDWLAVIGILASLVITFPELFLLEKGFLSGDHRAQHYPWAHFLAESLGAGRLPWWTSYFHCGFPLLAEGQVGGLYPFNLLFYSFLPVFPAYNYGILFHYFLGALFFFGYLRHLKLSTAAAFTGALVFLFGTAQGGYYYNIISLKTLIWLPLTFYLTDQLLNSKNRMIAGWLALIFSLQLLAGYLQYAVYSIAFTCLYFVWFAAEKWGSRQNLKGLTADAGFFLLPLMAGGLIALPQLGATLELSLHSNRYGFGEEFAYVGSMNPLALATIFFPHWDGFLGAEIYAGAFGLFLLCLSLFRVKTGQERFFWAMAFFALALALGRFNPLYVLFVKVTGFTSFRIPTKFIFFAAFAFSALCAFGYDKLFRLKNPGELKTPVRIYLGLTALGAAGLGLANFVLRVFSAPIRGMMRGYIDTHFPGSEVHIKPMDVYYARLESFYDGILRSISLTDPWNLLFLFFLAAGAVAVTIYSKSGRKRIRPWQIFFGLFLFANLWAYGRTSIKGDYETYDFIEPPSLVAEYVAARHAGRRVHRLFRDVNAADDLPLIPLSNMVRSVSVIGGYSPLIHGKYYELLSGLGDVNDSNNLRTGSPENFERQSALLDFLNVRYVISDQDLGLSGFEHLFEEEGIRLYENRGALPRAFFVSRSETRTFGELKEKIHKGDFSPSRKAYLVAETLVRPAEETAAPEFFIPARTIEDQQNALTVKVQAPSRGYLVVSDLFYPGWKVRVNGKPAALIQANGVFRAVPIPGRGDYEIRFDYEPLWMKLIPLSVGMAGVCLLLGLRGLLQRKTHDAG